MPQAHETLGVDLAGVVMDRSRGVYWHTPASAAFLDIGEVEGAVDSIMKLRQRFGERIHIVSICLRVYRPWTRLWFSRRDIFKRSGIEPDQVRFCSLWDGKASICKELGVTHFIDDHPLVLHSLKDAVPERYLFRVSPKRQLRYAHLLDGMVQVESWDEILRKLLP